MVGLVCGASRVLILVHGEVVEILQLACCDVGADRSLLVSLVVSSDVLHLVLCHVRCVCDQSELFDADRDGRGLGEVGVHL